MEEFLFYFNDLTEEAQSQLMKAVGVSSPREMNDIVVPVTTKESRAPLGLLRIIVGNKRCDATDLS